MVKHLPLLYRHQSSVPLPMPLVLVITNLSHLHLSCTDDLNFGLEIGGSTKEVKVFTMNC